MNFEWLKRYVPRGIYGRAALILLLPIITLQVVVSVIFIQRHFEDVTRQMTASLVLDLGYLQQEVNSAPTLEAALVRINKLSRPLAMNVVLPAEPVPTIDTRGLLDLSGRIVILTLKERNRRVLAVDLTKDSDFVEIWMRTNHGVMSVSVLRGRVSAPNPHQFLVLMLFVSLLMTLVAFVFLRALPYVQGYWLPTIGACVLVGAFAAYRLAGGMSEDVTGASLRIQFDF